MVPHLYFTFVQACKVVRLYDIGGQALMVLPSGMLGGQALKVLHHVFKRSGSTPGTRACIAPGIFGQSLILAVMHPPLQTKDLSVVAQYLQPTCGRAWAPGSAFGYLSMWARSRPVCLQSAQSAQVLACLPHSTVVQAFRDLYPRPIPGPGV